MSNIPAAREALTELAKTLDLRGQPLVAASIREIVRAHLNRKPAVRRARTSSTPMTPELAEEIRQYAKGQWGTPLADIALHFNVNPGRVSEALNHQR